MIDQYLLMANFPLLQIIGRLGCGAVILSTEGHVMAANCEAQRIFIELLDIPASELNVLDGSGRETIKHLLAKARTRIQLDDKNWMLLTRPSRRPLIMSAVAIPAYNDEGPHTILILIDLHFVPQARVGVLENIFGLTAAETRLVATLASGSTVNEAAAIHNVSVTTVRSQLASIFAKTNTSRQAELIMLISRLKALP